MMARYYGKHGHYRALRSLSRACEYLRLPNSVKNRAFYLFRKVLNHLGELLLRRHVHVQIASYCLLHASKEFPVPITIRDIIRAFRKLGHKVSVRSMIRTSSYCQEITGRPKIKHGEDYLPIIAEKLPIPHEHKRRLLEMSYDLLKRIGKRCCGRNPYVLAVYALYTSERLLADKEEREPMLKQWKLSQITSVSEYTIRDTFKWMEKYA